MSALLRIVNGTLSAHGGPPLTDTDVSRFVLDVDRRVASAAFRSSWDWTTPRAHGTDGVEVHHHSVERSSEADARPLPKRPLAEVSSTGDFEPDPLRPSVSRRHDDTAAAEEGFIYFTTLATSASNTTAKSLYGNVSNVHLAAQGLKLSQFMLLVPFLLKTTSLRVLAVPHNFLGDEGVRVLAQCIEAQMPCLRILDISNNNVSPLGCVDIAKAFFRQLSDDDTTRTHFTTTDNDKNPYTVGCSTVRCHNVTERPQEDQHGTGGCFNPHQSLIQDSTDPVVQPAASGAHPHTNYLRHGPPSSSDTSQCTNIGNNYCTVHQARPRQVAAQFRLHSEEDLDSSKGRRRPARSASAEALSEVLCLDISDNPVGLDGCFDLAEAIRLSKRFVHLSVRNVALESAAGVLVFASCLSQLLALDLSGNQMEFAATAALESFPTRLYQTWALASCHAAEAQLPTATATTTKSSTAANVAATVAVAAADTDSGAATAADSGPTATAADTADSGAAATAADS
eukprot:Lankesteria_metandrocarpae@DN2117_c0_g1_i1.p1